jgi:ppGpp synthetase/RelA/SpoT-type nucleotidyltranferase
MEHEEFLRKFGISRTEFERTGMDWYELDLIKRDHLQNTIRLEAAAKYVADRLRTLAEVHTVRARIKDPEHLIAKIIRKKLEYPDITMNVGTYPRAITDLVGVRALHLFKEDWETIHEFVVHTWDLNKGPVASICEGDHEEFIARFKERGCTIHNHPFGYRSVHYLVSFAPSKAESTVVEIQVRTILEEAWSEIDHLIRYPYGNGKSALSPYLLFLNRLLGNADEMGSFIRLLSENMMNSDAGGCSECRRNESPGSRLRRDVRGLPIEIRFKELLEERVGTLEEHLASLKTLPRYENVSDAFSHPPKEVPSICKSQDWTCRSISRTESPSTLPLEALRAMSTTERLRVKPEHTTSGNEGLPKG